MKPERKQSALGPGEPPPVSPPARGLRLPEPQLRPAGRRLFDAAIRNWNFFDRLVSLQNGAAPAECLFADRPEWRAEEEEILWRTAEAESAK